MRKKIMALVISMAMFVSCFGAVGVYAAEQTMDFDTAYTMMQDMSEYLAAQSPADRDYLYNWVHSYMKTDLGVEALITLVDDQTEVGSNQVILDYIFSFGTSEEAKSNLRFGLALAKCIPTDARAKAFDDMKARKEFNLTITGAQEAAMDAVYDAFLSDEYKDMLNHDEHKLNKLVIMQFLADLNKTFVLTDDIDTPADFELYKLDSEFKSKIESGELKGTYETVNGVDWKSAEELFAMFADSANSSEMFEDDAMKANFKAVLGIVGIDMYVAREFDAEVSGILEQVEDETSDIVFNAVSNITTDDLSAVEWYVDGVSAGTGESFTYNPSDLTAGESAVVTAKLGAYEKEFTVKVVEKPSFTMSITAAGELEQKVGSTSAVTFTAASDPEGEDLSETVWYVNGQLQSVKGETFEFTPAEKGEYVVYSVLNGAKSNEITVTVDGVYGKVSITSSGKLTQTKGSYYPVTFTAVAEDDFTDVSEAKWYINGVDQTTTGETFVFTPGSVGVFVIKAVMPDGSESVNTITVTVKAKVSSSSSSTGGSYYNPSTGDDDKEDEVKEPDYGDITQPIIAPTQTDNVTKFEDLEGHWAEPYMEYMYEKGIFEGTSETTINPDWGITRQEVAVLLVRMLSLENEIPSGAITYIDDEAIADWARDAVYILSDRGLYVGYGDGSFQPERIISRQELVSVIGRLLEGEYSINLDYIDAHEIYFWAVEHVEELTAFGIIQGFEDNSFRPEDFVTRAQAAVIFYNTMYRLGVFRVTL